MEAQGRCTDTHTRSIFTALHAACYMDPIETPLRFVQEHWLIFHKAVDVRTRSGQQEEPNCNKSTALLEEGLQSPAESGRMNKFWPTGRRRERAGMVQHMRQDKCQVLRQFDFCCQMTFIMVRSCGLYRLHEPPSEDATQRRAAIAVLVASIEQHCGDAGHCLHNAQDDEAVCIPSPVSLRQ